MSNRHTKKRLFCLFALFVLLSQFTSGCIEIRRTDSPETMSAMQAKDIVDEYIQWDDNYTVSHIRKGGMVSEDGGVCERVTVINILPSISPLRLHRYTPSSPVLVGT